jgi:glutathione S-transferase
LSGSPFAWRVWLALDFKGLNYRKVDLSFEKGDLRSESFLSLNPRGKIPVIVDEGVALSESSVILEYLDEQYPGDLMLFPRDVVKRAQLRKLSNEVDIYLDLANRRLLNSVFFTAREKWDEDKISRALSGVMKELDYFETAFIDSLNRRAAAIFEFSMFL